MLIWFVSERFAWNLRIAMVRVMYVLRSFLLNIGRLRVASTKTIWIFRLCILIFECLCTFHILIFECLCSDGYLDMYVLLSYSDIWIFMYLHIRYYSSLISFTFSILDFVALNKFILKVSNQAVEELSGTNNIYYESSWDNNLLYIKHGQICSRRTTPVSKER